jgi:hypothetical protein
MLDRSPDSATLLWRPVSPRQFPGWLNVATEGWQGHSESKEKFSAARRRLLRLLGLGIGGTALGSVGVTDRVFAKQFATDGTKVTLPRMAYDADLQMMVNPDTRIPIYEDAKKIPIASGLPTITSGCGDCPKKDDDGS